ncbi:MAG TPA: right-handed parallel beta-helix repeat-containing protein [Phycisphaerae bacterium]|nr:right-handed parallel beta-helix repeat-containing protein [Phycisphaerae bacterium]
MRPSAGDGYAQTTWYVDDDAPGDPGAGDPTVSDPNEDGSADHPFDAIGEGINAAVNGDTVLVLDGEYTGVGNRDLDFGGRLITVRSANGAAGCVIDCQGLGRGFYFHSGETAAAVVEGLTITNGSADVGGGMYNNYDSSPTVTDCTFRNNTAGGGMYNWDSSPTVTLCTFSGNTAGFGGGMYNQDTSNPTVTHCTFSGNTATSFGGGMCNWNNSNPTVTLCTFSGNTAGNGGGMYNWESSPTVTHCTFSGNTADVGGGMYNEFDSSPTVTQCTFSGNTADVGGGMYNRQDSSPTVSNCILWNDTPEEIYNYDDPNYPSAPTVTYSDVQGGYPGTGNINAAPLFAGGGNLRLACSSPCVDAGNNAAPGLAGVTADLDGNPRFVDDLGVTDSGAGTPPIVDMGAYERQDDSSPGGATIYVPGDYGSIQEAIDHACPTDEIIVAPGTYHEAIDFGGKAITVRSSDGADVTTIDATGLSASVVTCAGGEGADTVLEGFTITGGTGTLHFEYLYGGGMHNWQSSPTVTDCTFSGNSADYGGGMWNLESSPTVTQCTFSGNSAGYYGGGMYNAYSSPTVTHCTFSGNTAPRGGGMANWYGSSPTVTDCTFSGNTAGDGGGMCNDNSSPTVTHCTFSANDAWGGGGGMWNLESSPTVTQCTFSGNRAYDYGGGMYNAYSSPTVTHCTFSANTANYGGGMWNLESSPTVTQCTFSGNRAYDYGGGMYNAYSSPTVTHCTFSANTAAGRGGGMFNVYYSNPMVSHCTFSGNTAGFGGGMYNQDTSNPTVTHCTFSGNTASSDGGGMYSENNCSPTVTNCVFWNDTPNEIYNDGTSSPVVTYSDVQGAYAGTGNINDDPLFADAGSGDYHLTFGSPCINAGDNAAAVVFADTTTGAGTQTSVIVVDPSRYAIDDEIEYDGDGVLRTVTGVDPNSGQVSFDDPLAASSEPNAPIGNYGWGDIDGDDRILDYTVDMGADEFVPAQLMTTEPPADGSLPKAQNNLILCVFDRAITLPASVNPLVVKDMTNGCADVSDRFVYSIDPDDPNGCTLEARETDPNDPNVHDVLPDLTWYQINSAPDWTMVKPFQFEVCTLVGDCEGGGRVTTLDHVCVRGAIGRRGDLREDLDGGGRVTTLDYLVVKDHIGLRAPSKPALCP